MSDAPRHERDVDQLPDVTPDFARVVLQYFRSNPTDVATVDDLADYICENDDSADAESDVRIRLHHSTLPKLGNAGLLDYDERTNTARFRGETRGDEVQTPAWVPDD